MDIESAQKYLKIAADNSQECSKKLEAKNVEITNKNTTEEKTKMQEQLTQLTVQIKQTYATR